MPPWQASPLSYWECAFRHSDWRRGVIEDLLCCRPATVAALAIGTSTYSVLYLEGVLEATACRLRHYSERSRVGVIIAPDEASA
jgi:hypothetical protein